MKNPTVENTTSDSSINLNARFLFVVDQPKNKVGIQFLMVKNLCRKIGLSVSDIEWTDLTSETLEEDVSNFLMVVPIGREPIKHFLGEQANILHYRGRPVQRERRTFFPILSISEAIAKEEQMEIMKNDLLRMNLLSLNGGNKWNEPHIIIKPNVHQLREFLDTNGIQWTFDLEVDGINPFECNIRCIAIGNHQMIMVIPFRSIDGEKKFYTPMEMIEINAILIGFFQSEKIIHSGHNVMMFDSIVLKQRLGIQINAFFDTMVAHSVVQSKMPHDLGFCASYYTFAPNWKTQRKLVLKGDVRETDEELHRYCAYDVATTSIVSDRIMKEIMLNDLQLATKFYMGFQRALSEIHIAGIYVDTKSYRELEREIGNTLHLIKINIADILKYPDFNPNSNAEVGTLLCDHWGLSGNAYVSVGSNKDGSYSINDTMLKACLSSKRLDERQRDVIESIRRYRRLQYFQSHQIGMLSKVDGNGRIHPDINFHTSSHHTVKTSLEKIPSQLLHCLQPKEGSVFLSVQMIELELVFVSYYMNCPQLHKIIDQSKHIVKEIAKIVTGKKDSDETTHSKKFIHLIRLIFRSMVFQHDPEKIHRMLLTVEDKNGRLQFPDISLREVKAVHQKMQELFQVGSIKEIISKYDADQYVVEPILKNRLSFCEYVIEDYVMSSSSGLFNFFLSTVVKGLKAFEFESNIVYIKGHKFVIECREDDIRSIKSQLADSLDIFSGIINFGKNFLYAEKINNLGEV